MYCTECGSYNQDDNHYCENCGAFLDAQKIMQISLKDDEHNLEFVISSTPYVIGTSKNRAQGVAAGRGVSRCHAQITGSGDYYITDLNSTNGTFVNNKKISPGVKVKLENGMKIRMAEFTFTVNLE